ncbi:hypothetical protein GCM10007977_001330 [Dactylosporangium sucinum]|uniref:Uncharacterized protein n=1 Tax=Dactylosporangium sucinum TaxID=1424081 RepID=A0A917SZH7_9ACTN|nr:hypothetical protein GCM10007977_001330 [Dactylosporangium sucinum]
MSSPVTPARSPSACWTSFGSTGRGARRGGVGAGGPYRGAGARTAGAGVICTAGTERAAPMERISAVETGTVGASDSGITNRTRPSRTTSRMRLVPGLGRVSSAGTAARNWLRRLFSSAASSPPDVVRGVNVTSTSTT